jgi:hypothetical protein
MILDFMVQGCGLEVESLLIREHFSFLHAERLMAASEPEELGV